ncbi:MAG: aminopeptidase P family protein [Deltaproteobacteria bacterium]|nr:aminopeptidase P family protein [Deltaproteobacteria bacterium]
MALNKPPEPKGYTFYGPKPHLPDVPYGEWKARIEKARSLMEEEGIDLLLLASEKNCRYFTASTHGHWLAPSLQPQVALIPLKGECVIVCGEFFRTTFEAQSWIRDIRCQPDPHQIEHEREFPAEVAGLIKEMGCGQGKIAVEQGPLGHMYIPRPPNHLKRFVEELPEATLADGDRIIWSCRQIKSPLEIDRMRKAAAIHRQAMSTIVEEYRPGMTEKDVGKIFMHSLIESGADWTQSSHICCGADKEGVFDCSHQFDGIAINKGDYIWIDIVVPYMGYWADNGRVFNVGPVSDELRKNYEITWEAFDAAAEAAGPGIKASQVWQAQADVLKKAGFEAFEMCGHGIGLDIHEPPVLGYSDDTALEPGMTLELEILVFPGFRRTGGLGPIHYENMLIIGEEGCEMIHGLKRDIIQVSHSS